MGLETGIHKLNLKKVPVTLCIRMSAVLTNFGGFLGRVVGVFFRGSMAGLFFLVSRVFLFLESRSHCPMHHVSNKISLSMSHSMRSPPQSHGSYISEQLEGDTADEARTQAEDQTASPYSKPQQEKTNNNKKPKKLNPKTSPKP